MKGLSIKQGDELRSFTEKRLRKAMNQLKQGKSPRARDKLVEMEIFYAHHRNEWLMIDGELASARKKLGNHVECYAKPACMRLCKEMIERLPRELRDHIYDTVLTSCHPWLGHKIKQIIECGPPIIRGERQYQTRVVDDFAPPKHVYGHDPPEHLWQEEFVGPTVRRELVESFYRSSRFWIVRSSTPSLVQGFLTIDKWNLGIQPWKLVSRIAICFRENEYLRERVDHIRDRITLFRPGVEVLVIIQMSHRSVNFGPMYGRAIPTEEYRRCLVSIIRALKELGSSGYRVRAFLGTVELDLKAQITTPVIVDIINEFKKREISRQEEEERVAQAARRPLAVIHRTLGTGRSEQWKQWKQRNFSWGWCMFLIAAAGFMQALRMLLESLDIGAVEYHKWTFVWECGILLIVAIGLMQALRMLLKVHDPRIPRRSTRMLRDNAPRLSAPSGRPTRGRYR